MRITPKCDIMFNDQEKHISKGVILMISITEVARFRQQVIKYSLKNGVTKASIRYRVSRNSIYRWKKRYDGTWQSLKDRSHRPKSHPKQHTKQEHDLIMRYYHRNKDDKIVLWMKIREKGYKRSYAVMCQYIRRQGIEKIDKKKYRKNKPYRRVEYPGQKVQIDVKYVPSYCISNGKKYYQYTAVDECTRWTYREMYDEHSTYSSLDFLIKLIKTAPFPIREIQTDNGTEWTKALISKSGSKTLFEKQLEEYDIIYHRIRVATPRHNGKVERQHGIDEKRFYRKMRMYGLADGRKQLKKYNRISNKIPKICLNFSSPNEILERYQGVI